MSTVAGPSSPSPPQPSHSGPGSVLQSGVQIGGAGCQRGCEEEGPTPVACSALLLSEQCPAVGEEARRRLTWVRGLELPRR